MSSRKAVYYKILLSIAWLLLAGAAVPLIADISRWYISIAVAAVDSGTLGDLLDEPDGFQSDDDVIFIVTTNAIDRLEAAIKDRPGRINQCVLFDLPSENQALTMHEDDYCPVVRSCDERMLTFGRNGALAGDRINARGFWVRAE